MRFCFIFNVFFFVVVVTSCFFVAGVEFVTATVPPGLTDYHFGFVDGPQNAEIPTSGTSVANASNDVLFSSARSTSTTTGGAVPPKASEVCAFYVLNIVVFCCWLHLPLKRTDISVSCLQTTLRKPPLFPRISDQFSYCALLSSQTNP